MRLASTVFGKGPNDCAPAWNSSAHWKASSREDANSDLSTDRGRVDAHILVASIEAMTGVAAGL